MAREMKEGRGVCLESPSIRLLFAPSNESKQEESECHSSSSLPPPRIHKKISMEKQRGHEVMRDRHTVRTELYSNTSHDTKHVTPSHQDYYLKVSQENKKLRGSLSFGCDKLLILT